jgi:hypothetical protein
MWVREKREWFLKIEGGIASRDTFGRLFGLIDVCAFESAFRRWVNGVLPGLAAQELVALKFRHSAVGDNRRQY